MERVYINSFDHVYPRRNGRGEVMDELLQNVQDFTDEIASTIRLAIWAQIMSGNTLEDENDAD